LASSVSYLTPSNRPNHGDLRYQNADHTLRLRIYSAWQFDYIDLPFEHNGPRMQHLASVRRTIAGEPQLMPYLTPRGFLDILTMDLIYDPDTFMRRLNQARHNYTLSRGEEMPRSAVPAFRSDKQEQRFPAESAVQQTES
jgi:hypothetical protein